MTQSSCPSPFRSVVAKYKSRGRTETPVLVLAFLAYAFRIQSGGVLGLLNSFFDSTVTPAATVSATIAAADAANPICPIFATDGIFAPHNSSKSSEILLDEPCDLLHP